MTDGGLTVLDGTTLRAFEPRLPDSNDDITGAQILNIAETEASSSLFGLSLPETLKSNALKRINIDAVNFASIKLDREQASSKLKEYVIAIADELKDDPLVVSVLDGSPLRLFLEDEDDFAMLAENLFTDLDIADKGKIKKKEIRNALDHMGVELGVPPFSEFPLLEDILGKHGADEEEELGQAQFAESLQPVLQDLADALAKKNVVIVQGIKIINGSQLRKLLTDEEQLNNVVEEILHDMGDSKDEKGCREAIRVFLEKNRPMLGLPPPEANEAVSLLHNQVFSDVDSGKTDGEFGRDKFAVLVKDILEKFAEHLEAGPIFHDLDG